MSQYEFGSGILTGLRNDVSGVQTPWRLGALQDVTISFQGEQKELFSFNTFPVDSARGKTKIQGKAKFAEIKAQVYNSLFFGQTVTSGQLKFAFNETTTLGTGTPSYTIANAASTPLTDQGVFYQSNGEQLQSVSSGAVSGQYSFNASTGVFTFSTFDVSTAITVNYTYTTTTGQTITGANPLMGTTPRFQATLMQQYETTNGLPNQIVLVLPNCVGTMLDYPTRVDDYVIQGFDFVAYASSSGVPFYWYTGF
jgi:hypothetical protein